MKNSIIKRCKNPYDLIAKAFEYRVVKANQFVCCKASLSLLQHRILIEAIVEIKPTDTEFREYLVSFQKIVKVSGSYKQISVAVEKMKTSEIYIFCKDEWYKYNLVENIKIEKINRRLFVFLQFNPELKKYFIGLSQNYLSYPYLSILEFRSAYSLRIYEICKQYEKIGVRTLSLDYLKYILCATTKYKYLANFELRVLNPAISEINKLSDIYVSFGKIRDANYNYNLIFKIVKNQNYTQLGKREKSRIEQDL